MKLRILGIIIVAVFCGQVSADMVWVGSHRIKSVMVYNENNRNVITVRFKENAVFDTGCAPTDQHGIVSFLYKSDLNNTHQGLLSVLLSAQAQSLPVNVLLDADDCNTSSVWGRFGNPAGLGLNLLGVEVVSN